ncbi:MAG: uracil-DNA glycosylase [Myxococcota bacterium]
MTNSHSSDLKGIRAQAAALLRFQGELGLQGLDISLAQEGARAAADPAPPAVTPGRTSLATVRATLGDCQRCKLAAGRTHIVFGVGNPEARLMFVGEGPGRDEDLQGEPFVGAAGQLLDKMIQAMGLKRTDVYIANMVKCRPPQNRDPEKDEIAACEPFLIQQIVAIQPEVVVALGRCAAQSLLRDTTAISRLRGTWRSYQGIALMPTFHPAYLLRSPEQKRLVWQDLQNVMQRLGLPSKRA